MTVLIRSGNSNGQIRRISAFAAGTITVDTAFASVITLGTKYDILGQHAIAAGTGDATLANQTLMLADIGDASTSTLGSLYGIVGNPAAGQDLATRIGYEGASSLADKLTAARSGYLDFIPPIYYGLVSAVNQATGGATATITLAAGASAVNDFYKGQIVTVYAGLGAGQARAIVAYDGGTKIATVSPSWATAPDATSFYIIIATGSAVISNPAVRMPIENYAIDLATAAELASGFRSVYTDARGGYLDNINQAGLLQVTATRAGYLDNIATTAMGNQQVKRVTITSDANAGDVTVATITTQACIIDSIIIYASTAQTANMTTCAITGGASKVITFIGTNDATQANLNAIDKQVGWTGAVRLAAAKTIVISLLGTPGVNVDLRISITYHAEVSGGYLT